MSDRRFYVCDKCGKGGLVWAYHNGRRVLHEAVFIKKPHVCREKQT